MYSGHNFYFKPYIVSFALLPVIDRKGIEAQGLSNGKHHHDTVQLTPRTTCFPLLPKNAIAKRFAYASPAFVCVLLCGRSWTTQSPIITPERERSLRGRKSHLSDGTVTGNYKTVLEHEATAKPLLQYIQQKNKWAQSVTNYIHWDAHGKALRQRPEKRTHMTKLLHEILPTTAQANKFDRGTRCCPLCPSQTKDRDHI